MIYNLFFTLILSCSSNIDTSILMETDWNKHNLKGKVFSYNETRGFISSKSFRFNKNGFIKSEYYGGGERKYIYKNDKLFKVETYITSSNSQKSEKNGYWEYEYNKLNKVSKEIYTRLNDNAKIETQMVYNKNGFVKEYIRYEHSSICKYDSIGNMTSKIQYSFKNNETRNDSTLILKENFEYNSKNLLINHSSLRADKLKNINYKYNSENDIIEKTIKNQDKHLEIHTYEYTYDTIGNWISRIHKMPNGNTIRHKRKYKYYE